MLFLETCVSFGNAKEINLEAENHKDPTQAISGVGCRPTRIWLFEKLEELFEYVYLPKTQPSHEEFPLDWTVPRTYENRLSRAMFIGSREEIEKETLSTSLLSHQTRHE